MNSKISPVMGLLALSMLAGCSVPHMQTGQATLPPAITPDTTQPMPAAASPSLNTHHWTLNQAFTAGGTNDPQWFLPTQPSASARRIALDFGAHQQLVVNNLCNRMGGAYETRGQALKIQRLMSTMMACDNPALMALEHKVGQRLPQVQSWRILQQDPARLEITFADGGHWQLQGQIKYTTLYGEPQRVFLEISPTQTPCNHPLMPNAQCLQVRHITYGKNGLKESVGTWEPFYDSIEGYVHQSGVRSVLRLDRYTRVPAPTDGSRYLYVLDIMVEQETMRTR